MSVLRFLVAKRELVEEQGPLLTYEVTKLYVYVGDRTYTLTPGERGSLEVEPTPDYDTGDLPKAILRPRKNGVGIGQE